MQRIKELFTGEDRAVSPVIGVILMVAITVILAAVIATFVIGLGDSADEVAPTASLTGDFENSSGSGAPYDNVTITVDNVDTSDISTDNVFIRGDGVSGLTWQNATSSSVDFSAGNSVTLNSSKSSYSEWESGDTIEIVYESSDTSDTLDEIEAP